MADDPNDNKPNPAETFQRLLAQKNNDATALASQLFDENFQLRQKNRELANGQPKEGSVVLSADEAKIWKAYQDLGVEPKEIKKALEKLPTLEQENRNLSRMEGLREIASINKVSLDALKEAFSNKYPEASFEFKEETNDKGEKAKVAYIKPTPDGQAAPFSTFASENLTAYALKVDAEPQPSQPGNTHDPKPQGGPASTFEKIRESVKAKNAADQPVSLIDRFRKPANA